MRWLHSLHTDGTEVFTYPQNPTPGQKLTIRLRVLHPNPIKKIYLRVEPEGEELRIPMKIKHKDELFEWYSVKIDIFSKVFHYRFKVITNKQIFWYNAAGIVSHTPCDDMDFRIITDFTTPKWLSKSVFYQIFPDTFCRKGKLSPQANDYRYRGRIPHYKNWGERPGEYKETYSLDFFGGNLSGIESKISYLKQIGVNALYLNPIFQAPSNHRYDIQDYYMVDRHLGTNGQFADLVKILHKNSMHIILDGIFNHSGSSCRWFNREEYYREPGAYQSKKSPYFDYYRFQEHPNKYYSWFNIDTLPKLDYRSAKLRNAIYRAKDSVIKYWLDAPYEIDGWRLDVANMIARCEEYQQQAEVLREMRQAAKEINPQNYFIGEHFFDASSTLQGDMFDGVMNYKGFCLPVRQWLAGQELEDGGTWRLTTEDMHRQLTESMAKISQQITGMQYNLLNCHDLPRLAGLLNNADLEKLATILLFTYPGIPSIYYGDEIGIGGRKTVESSRRCMEWDECLWDNEKLEFYRKLIQLRKTSKTLQKGAMKTLWATGEIYSFARFYRDELIVIVVNRGQKPQKCRLDALSIGLRSEQKLTDYFSNYTVATNKNGYIELNVAPGQSLILQ